MKIQLFSHWRSHYCWIRLHQQVRIFNYFCIFDSIGFQRLSALVQHKGPKQQTQRVWQTRVTMLQKLKVTKRKRRKILLKGIFRCVVVFSSFIMHVIFLNLVILGIKCIIPFWGVYLYLLSVSCWCRKSHSYDRWWETTGRRSSGWFEFFSGYSRGRSQAGAFS